MCYLCNPNPVSFTPWSTITHVLSSQILTFPVVLYACKTLHIICTQRTLKPIQTIKTLHFDVLIYYTRWCHIISCQNSNTSAIYTNRTKSALFLQKSVGGNFIEWIILNIPSVPIMHTSIYIDWNPIAIYTLLCALSPLWKNRHLFLRFTFSPQSPVGSVGIITLLPVQISPMVSCANILFCFRFQNEWVLTLHSFL